MLNRLNAAFRSRTFFKAISGIDVFDHDRVLPLVRAVAGVAHAVDVAADPALVQAARKAAPDLIIFASSIDPDLLVASGADVLELGNYDAMYQAGKEPSAAEVLAWTRQVVAKTQGKVPLCVTIPGRLPVAEQVDLARLLQAAGADMLQTEGRLGVSGGGAGGLGARRLGAPGAGQELPPGTSIDPPPGHDVAESVVHLAEALANTTAIRAAVDLPLILAGGVDPRNTPHAIAAGADGVGVGRFLKKAESGVAVAIAARQVQNALASIRTVGSAIKR